MTMLLGLCIVPLALLVQFVNQFHPNTLNMCQNTLARFRLKERRPNKAFAIMLGAMARFGLDCF
jgi:hypothetical protein